MMMAVIEWVGNDGQSGVTTGPIPVMAKVGMVVKMRILLACAAVAAAATTRVVAMLSWR